jgi:hypothetical protein
MDADVMITIAFCLEVFLFGFATALFVAREVSRSRSEATANIGTKPRQTPVRGAVRGLRP